MQFGQNDDYFSDVDGFSDKGPFFDSSKETETDEEGNYVVPDDALNFTHEEIGTTTNPMGNTLESLKARIREGNRRIEFSFIGQGKGNSQQPTPESFGNAERRDIRELLEQNKIKTSTHAGVHSQSLAGFTNDGFKGEAREQVMNEIKKAIDFAATATKGGAIVFHFQEWQRPMTEVKDSQVGNAMFRSYEEEEDKATKYVVDTKTGQFVAGVSKDQDVYRPVYITAKEKNIVGKKDSNGHILRDDDWVDIDGNYIAKNADVDRLMDRVPKYNDKTNHFEIQQLTWNNLVEEADNYNKEHDTKITPEELFARTQMENQAAQALGNSLYHGMRYGESQRAYNEYKRKWDAYEAAKKNTPKEDQWKLRSILGVSPQEFTEPGDDAEKLFKQRMRLAENSLRHIHESSATADAQAEEFKKRARRLKTVEEYGVQKTAETVSAAAMEAMRKYNANKDKYGLEDPIFVAPENWDARFYGSHPEEYMNLIKASRTKMVERLTKEGHSKKEAEDLAKTHIKGTLDIGHLNLFRSHFQAEDGETPEERDKRFDKWMLHWADKLTKEKYVGHIHIADNFGYDDEHLSPGQGNIPMKEFLKIMEKNGVKDITVEPGSYNISREVPDTLELIGSPIYGVNRRQRFNKVRNAQLGYNQPGYFIAGPYVPSNDWRPWSDVPLE
ncbi:sugar phosphate isomerase/epimerase [Candidatus Woesearchaeota archaeon]|nr:sugar phosphate isomerase/epimerase [Candidatus Woesearchaeota archaeon]MCF7900710.1 sugar phosphate isomerase/epimerase [Candidatus Woesearchaeota archaeon]MCF8013231.1 sugar phosphate isomerase/epimerase [Candidatus Woesearchaeota archaeon]